MRGARLVHEVEEGRVVGVPGNLAQIGVLIAAGPQVSGYALAEWVAWGAVLGSLLQLGVQLPVVFGLAGTLRPALGLARQHVRQAGG